MDYNIRDSTVEDSEFVYALRRDTEEFSPNKLGVFEDHDVWFKDNYEQYRIIMFKKSRYRIGFLRNQGGVVAIALIINYRGRGLGTKILNKTKGKANIMLNNERSLRAFTKAGWVIKGFYLENK